MSRRPFTVFIEGNIASGKTTLLEHFRKFDDVLILKEDIEKWTNFHGHNLLDLKFKNPEHFQYPFQSYAMLCRLRQHLECSTQPFKIMERSLVSARRCFVEAQKNLNLIHEGNYFVLQEWYDYIEEYHAIDCNLFIYVQTDPQIVFKRMQSRARKEEAQITIEYVQEIHDLHEKVFVHHANFLPAKVLIIDGNLSEKEMMTKEFKKCENAIFQKAQDL